MNKKFTLITLLSSATIALSAAAFVLANKNDSFFQAKATQYEIAFDGESDFEMIEDGYGNFILSSETERDHEEFKSFYNTESHGGTIVFSDEDSYDYSSSSYIISANGSGWWDGSAYINVVFHFYGPGIITSATAVASYGNGDPDSENMTIASEQSEDEEGKKYYEISGYFEAPYGTTNVTLYSISIKYTC